MIKGCDIKSSVVLCYTSSKNTGLQLSSVLPFYAIGKLRKIGVTDKLIKVSSAWLGTS